MKNTDKRIRELEEKLGELVDRHKTFTDEIKKIYREIQQLKAAGEQQASSKEPCAVG